MARLGRQGRRDAIGEMARWIREVHPDAVISVSDGGRTPDEEGDPYFDYHSVAELDYWNVHFPRDDVYAQGIPRWARGVWHLYSDRNESARQHNGRSYGRNDENIFMQTQEEHERWAYGNSTRDWRTYANMMWISTVSGVGFTLHNQKGFFCYPGVSSDPIMGPVRALVQITKGFEFEGARSYNTSWAGSPIREFDGPFKAFVLASRDRSDLLIHVLNPAGTLTLELDQPLRASFYDPISGALLDERDLPAGRSVVQLPAPLYEHAMTIRVRQAVDRPRITAPKRPAPTIDGDWADWAGVEFVELNPADHYQRVAGGSPSARDLSARFAVSWSDQAIHIAVETTDDVHFNRSAGEAIWRGDSVQVGFDGALDGGVGYDGDDRERGWALTAGGAQQWQWHGPVDGERIRGEFVVVRDGPMTRYEMTLPARELGDVELRADAEFGFTLLVNDNDGGGDDAVEGAVDQGVRQGWLEWTPGVGKAKRPDAFGTLRLAP